MHDPCFILREDFTTNKQHITLCPILILSIPCITHHRKSYPMNIPIQMHRSQSAYLPVSYSSPDITFPLRPNTDSSPPPSPASARSLLAPKSGLLAVACGSTVSKGASNPVVPLLLFPETPSRILKRHVLSHLLTLLSVSERSCLVRHSYCATLFQLLYTL